MVNQTKSLETNKPWRLYIFGRWVNIRSRKDVISWIRIRDKRIAKDEKVSK
jgi:hypothetical protein